MILDKFIKYPLYLLVFLLPLIFSPFTFEAYEFPKQYLLFFLASLAFFAWLAKLVRGRASNWDFRRRPLDIPVLAFLGAAILSALFSVDRLSSLFGFYGRFSDGLMGLVSCVMLYFVITNNVGLRQSVAVERLVSSNVNRLRKETLNATAKRNPEGEPLAPYGAGELRNRITLNGLLKTFLISLALVVLVSYLSVFGVWQKISFLPAVMQQRTFSPASASFASWLTPKIIFQNIPREACLSQPESWQLALKTISDSPKNFLFGTGPGTFHYDFAHGDSPRFAGTVPDGLWQLRFDRPGNHIAEILATTGILGLISYFVVIAMFLIVSFFVLQAKIRKSKCQNPNDKSMTKVQMSKKRFWILDATLRGVPNFVRSSGFDLTFVIWALTLVLFVAQFFYYQNTLLAFSFWFFLGLSVASWPGKKYNCLRFYLKHFCLVCLGIGLLISYLFLARFFYADVVYAQRFTFPQGELAALEKAAKLNPRQAQYRIILARAYLNKFLEETRKPREEQDSALMIKHIGYAIAYAKGAKQGEAGDKITIKGATELSSRSIAAWETTAMIYRDIRGVVKGALGWAISSYEKAIELEPANPIHHTELGKLYREAGELAKAKQHFEKALELKPDFVEAAIAGALVYEQEGDWQKAVSRLTGLAQDYPLLPQIFYELGRIYFNQGEFDLAMKQFNAVLVLVPEHSNALYSLGAVYKSKGDKVKAREYFEKVLELNPGNEDVRRKLEELE